MAVSMTFQEILEQATLLPPTDKLRLIGRIVPQIEHDLVEAQPGQRSYLWTSAQDMELDEGESVSDFEREIGSFQALRSELLATYPGEAVAIYQGKVVARGNDKMTVLDQVLTGFGPIPCYIETVADETPRRVRFPSAWKQP